MNHETVIEVRNVRKKFKIYFDKGKMLKERILFQNRNRYEERWVLNGISFDVKKGEAVGLIGQNGCGKSTTLKLLTRIMYPDAGEIIMKGRVSSLLELGAGFHPDMSGRENIYINASIFGLAKKEIDRRLGDIIAFSELEDYIDNPVRTYSSGMYMRLAFSVAINVDAEILLIDEILAVGDVNFQTKCFNKMLEIKSEGTTIVIVSHSMGQIESICDRSIWIHEGFIKEQGSAREVNNKYLNFMDKQRRDRVDDELLERANRQQDTIINANNISTGEEVTEENQRRGTGEARIEKISMHNGAGKEVYTFNTGEDFTFQIKYSIKEPIENAIFGISLFRIDDIRCYGTNSRVDNVRLFSLHKDGVAKVNFDKTVLLPGKYYVDVCIAKRHDEIVDYLEKVSEFEIGGVTEEMGFARMPHSWNI